MKCFKGVMHLFFLLVLLAGISGCADVKNKMADGVEFNNVGRFADRRGQANIVLVTYSGEAAIGNIKQYAEKLGCEMMFAFYYPESTDMDDIPIRQLEEAGNFGDARELLFKREGVGKWRFASQCFGLIPTVTDCLESPISPNCR
ncbi:MAG: hypothetical protein SCH71_08920 [Desulfobulbaceae bacterium]|nr:hypothetical protein [Desulfobulbaceae bacterium]